MKKKKSLLQSLVWSVTCQTRGKYVDRFLSVAKAEVSCFDQTKVISAFMEAHRNPRIFAAEKLKSEDSDYFKFHDCSNDESMIKVKNAFSTNNNSATGATFVSEFVILYAPNACFYTNNESI